MERCLLLMIPQWCKQQNEFKTIIRRGIARMRSGLTGFILLDVKILEGLAAIHTYDVAHDTYMHHSYKMNVL